MKYKTHLNILFFVLAILAAVTVCCFFYFDKKYYWLFVIPVVLGISILAFRDPIELKLLKEKTIDIEDELFNILALEFPIIDTYSASEKKSFRKSMFWALFQKPAYFVTKDSEALNIAHHAIICAPNILMNRYRKTDKMFDINRVIAYAHPFASPKMQFLHCGEYDHTDGVIIVSLEHALAHKRLDIYPIIYHLWAERFLLNEATFPIIPNNFTELISRIAAYDVQQIYKVLGYKFEKFEVIALVLYLTQKENFNAILPDYFTKIDNYMKLS